MRQYIITDEMVELKSEAFDWIRLAQEWGKLLRPERSYEHWRTQFHSIAECLPWSSDKAFALLELCPGSGVITEVLLETYPNLNPSIMEVQPIFKRMAIENIKARSGREPGCYSVDLREKMWWKVFDHVQFDVVVTSDALNGLSAITLQNVYRGVHTLLSAGGYFFNCDRVGSTDEHIQAMYDRVRSDIFGRNPTEWKKISKWWDDIGSKFGVDQYSRLWLKELSDANAPGLSGLPVEQHIRFLHEAGFQTADCIWHYYGDAIVCGIA